MELRTDPKRIGRYQDKTGIVVRAKGPQGFEPFDIAELSRASLLEWLRSRGEKNEWAESVVMYLLDHPISQTFEGGE
jgi:hypothetical protein